MRRAVRLVAAGLIAVWAGLSLILSGAAGAQVRQRTLSQLDHVNVLFGVRAEWASTLSLMAERPFGFGIGAQPDDADRADAVQAVHAAGGDWTARYFRDVVLGERVDLHSTVANLWFHFGVPGVIVALMVALILFRGIRDSAATTKTLGLGGIFLMLMASWDLLFSPMADVDRVVAGMVVALSVVAVERERSVAHSGT